MNGLHPSLSRPPSDLIGGRWRPIAGEAIQSREPARPAHLVWSGSPSVEHVDHAITAARQALPEWAARGIDSRAAVLRRFQKLCVQNAPRLTAIIRDEVGKVGWDAAAEAGLLSNKVDITLEGLGTEATNSQGFVPASRVRPFEVSLTQTRMGRCWFRPHGVMGVLGPFNFPAHLPNGHIIPALAMGNTIVFKPSEKAPGVGQVLSELLHEAIEQERAPDGVFNLVQGGLATAKRLVHHHDLDGILFTGSWPVGRSILEANLDRPGRMLALEMGGNNAAVILADADLQQAIIECVRSAFVTTGQRCTCTRRLIVHKDLAARALPAICKAASALIIGNPGAAHPVFMGPLISGAAREHVLETQRRLQDAGGEILVPCISIDDPSEPSNGGWYITPGVMRVDRFEAASEAPSLVSVGSSSSAPLHPGADVEIFGPLLRISVVNSLDEAIAQANATAFGLAASIFTRDQAAVDRFLREVRAGCINVNTGTAGASSKLPFGGLGLSGNHRPAGSFSLDYCAYPVAGMVEASSAAALPIGMTFESHWLE